MHSLKKLSAVWGASCCSGLALAGSAAAHPGHHHSPATSSGSVLDSVLAGALHPFFGIDHLLLILLVGWLSTQPGAPFVMDSTSTLDSASGRNRRTWWLPGGFLLALLAGGLCGLEGATAGWLEWLAILCVGLAGGWLLAMTRVPSRDDRRSLTLAAFMLTAGFVHGYLHGMALPTGTSSGLFLLGVLVGSSVILCFGRLLGSLLAGRPTQKMAYQVAGGLAIAVSLGMLFTRAAG